MDRINMKEWSVVDLACAVNAVTNSKLIDARNVIERQSRDLRLKCETEENLVKAVHEEDEKDAQINTKLLKLKEDIENCEKADEVGRTALLGESFKQVVIEGELSQWREDNEKMVKSLQDKTSEQLPIVIEINEATERKEKLRKEIELIRDEYKKMDEDNVLLEKKKGEIEKLRLDRKELLERKERDIALLEEKRKKYKSLTARKSFLEEKCSTKVKRDISVITSPLEGKFTVKSVRENLFGEKNSLLGAKDGISWYLNLTRTDSRETDSTEHLMDTYKRMTNRPSMIDLYGMKSPNNKTLISDNKGSRSTTPVRNGMDFHEPKMHVPDSPFRTSTFKNDFLSTPSSKHSQTSQVESPFRAATVQNGSFNAPSSKPVEVVETGSSLLEGKVSLTPLKGDVGSYSEVPLEFSNGGEESKKVINDDSKKTERNSVESPSSFKFAVPATPSFFQERSKGVNDFQNLNGQDTICPNNVKADFPQFKTSNKYAYLMSEYDNISAGQFCDAPVDNHNSLDLVQEIELSDYGELAIQMAEVGCSFELGNDANVLISEEKVKMENVGGIDKYIDAESKEKDFLNELPEQCEEDSGSKSFKQVGNRRCSKRNLYKDGAVNGSESTNQANEKVKKAKKATEKVGKAKRTGKSKVQEKNKPNVSLFENKNENIGGLFGSNSINGENMDNGGLFGSNSINRGNMDNGGLYGSNSAMEGVMDNGGLGVFGSNSLIREGLSAYDAYEIDKAYHSSLRSPLCKDYDMETGFNSFEYKQYDGNVGAKSPDPSDKPFHVNFCFSSSPKQFSFD